MRRRITLALLWVIAGVLPVSAQTPPVRVTADQARKHRGKMAVVCGTVVAAVCKEGEGTNLYFDPPYGRSMFTIVVPLNLRASFGLRMEDRFLGSQVCATGRVEKGRYSGQQIVATAADTITIEKPPRASRERFVPAAHRPCDPDVSVPKMVKEVKAVYTTNALNAKVQGVVIIQAVVEPDGNVGAIEVLHSLHPDLDREAVGALKQWRFEPGTYANRPAPVIVVVEMSFTMK